MCSKVCSRIGRFALLMVSNQSSLMLGNVTCETDGLKVYVRERWKWRTSEIGAKNNFPAHVGRSSHNRFLRCGPFHRDFATAVLSLGTQICDNAELFYVLATPLLLTLNSTA